MVSLKHIHTHTQTHKKMHRIVTNLQVNQLSHSLTKTSTFHFKYYYISLQAIHVILVLAATFPLRSTAGRLHSHDNFRYCAISCRAIGASLTDFGGVGDGTTSNTKAFQAAISHLGQYAEYGGSMLFVPPGKWLTGSFNLTSHFTLFLHKDAVLLASQEESEWAVIEPLPSYGRGRDTEGGRYISLIFGTNLTDVIITGQIFILLRST